MVTQNLLRKISVQMLYTRKCDKGPVNVYRRDEHKEVKLRLYDMLAKRISRLTHFAVTALKKKRKINGSGDLLGQSPLGRDTFLSRRPSSKWLTPPALLLLSDPSFLWSGFHLDETSSLGFWAPSHGLPGLSRPHQQPKQERWCPKLDVAEIECNK